MTRAHDDPPRAIRAFLRRLLPGARGRDDVNAFAPRLRELASALDPDLRIDRVANLARLPNARFLAMASALLQLVFGIVVLLSAAGVHALMSVTVTQRRREVGVRALAGLIAATGPALRGLRIHPMEALRDE